MRRWTIWIILVDLLWTATAFVASVVLRYGSSRSEQQWVAFRAFAPYAALTAILWVALSLSTKLDTFRGGWHFPAVFSRVVLAVSVVMSVLLTCGYVFHDFLSRLVLAYFGLLLTSGFMVVRYATGKWLQSRYGKGSVSKVMIIGWGRIAQELATKISRHPEMLCKVVGFLTPRDVLLESDSGTSGVSAARSMISTLSVCELLRDKHVDQVILALSRPAWPEVLKMADKCREQGIVVSIVPHPYELYLSKPEFTDLDGMPLLRLQTHSKNGAPHSMKRTFDLVVGVALSCIAMPVVLVSAAFLKVKKGRAFLLEERCGLQGNCFRMWRLNVDRYTSSRDLVENLMSRLSITELPQLWNVIRGEMSLVGPRPESLDRVRLYSEWHQQRLSVKPGITGLAQVHGLREHHSSEEKARFDLQYRLNSGLFLDVSLLLQTIWTVAGRLLHGTKADNKGQVFPLAVEAHEDAVAMEAYYSANSTQSSAD
jgi:lipopolysaccharide/colanic/teichoic acid biosynthesis glycosyltransferase